MRRFTVYPTNNIYGGPVNFDDFEDLNNQRNQRRQQAQEKEQAKNDTIKVLHDATAELISFATPIFEELENVINSDIQQIVSKYVDDEDAFLQCFDGLRSNVTLSPV